MGNDVKSLIDDIIKKTDNSYNDTGTVANSTTPESMPIMKSGCQNKQAFDSGRLKEKVSLGVLHDIVAAMMHDDTQNLDQMIDDSINRHMRDNYDGTCYGYLCNARDRLRSPLLGDIVQEVDDKTDEIEDKVEETKDDDIDESGEINIKVMLKDVTNYDEFRDKLKKQVSNKVVNDVSNVITQRNDAPVFDDLDDVMTKKDADDVSEEENNTEGNVPEEGENSNEEDVTNESVIFKLCGAIVSECAIEGNPITTNDGLERAIVEYCLCEMDYLFKSIPKQTMYQKYNI